MILKYYQCSLIPAKVVPFTVGVNFDANEVVSAIDDNADTDETELAPTLEPAFLRTRRTVA